MPPVFAAHDIQFLISAFPPPLPDAHKPSLLRSTSDELLIDSSSVLRRFRELLNDSVARIRISDLPSILRVDDTTWLLHADGDPLVFSADREDVIPRSEVEAIHHSLEEATNEGFVDLVRYAQSKDVLLNNLNGLIDPQIVSGSLLEFNDADLKWVTSTKFMTALETNLRQSFTTAGNEDFDVVKRFPNIPLSILQRTSINVLANSVSPLGNLKLENNCLLFNPAGLIDKQKADKEASRQNRIDESIHQISEQGYCLVDDANLLDDIEERGKSDEKLVKLAVLQKKDALEETSMAVVDSRWLSSIVDQMNNNLARAMADAWASRKDTQDFDKLELGVIEQLLQDTISSPALSELILESDQITLLKTKMAAVRLGLQERDAQELQQAFSDLLLAPLHLHAVAVNAITDATLVEHLEQFCGDYARRELVPDAIKSLRERKLLYEKSTSRAIEKLEQAVSEAKFLNPVLSAALKFAKKQKIPLPSEDSLKPIKEEAQKRKLKAMHASNRGSDVLQNLLWILLGAQTDGLYLSSGKDTSRMIKFYGSIGNSEILDRLQQWRDLLKSGDITNSDLQEMRNLAANAIRGTD